MKASAMTPHPTAKPSSARGIAAVELALLLPLLLIALAGILEIGMAVLESIQVEAAVEAGALHAARNGTTNLPAIRAAAAGATGFVGIVADDPVLFCGCPSASGIAGQGTDCTTTCPGGALPGRYLRLTASVPHAGLLPLLDLGLPAAFSALAVIRVE